MTSFREDLRALSNEDFAWLDAACDRFEQSWKRGERPQIESLIDAVSEAQRVLLLDELVRQEFELRLAANERPTLTEYRRRFPNLPLETNEWIEEQFVTLSQPLAASTIETSNVAAPVDNEATLTSNPAPMALSSAPERLTISKVFGRYTIERELGRGGMGAVFLAQDRQLGRRVALKIPFFRPEDRQTAIDRFFREARAMALLEHPNLCPIYDVGEIDGRHFISMAYIEGQMLSDFLSSTATESLPLQDGVKLLSKVAVALHQAHQAGVVHRDLKPSNIMIRRDGEPIVMDFGLAKMNELKDISLTHSGSLVGSPAYMSPEQVESRHEEIGPSTDVYSLGVILYQLLCGRRPYEGSVASVLGQIVGKDALPPSCFAENVPRELQSIAMRAIAKSPSDRYATALEMGEALQQYLTNPTSDSADATSLPTLFREKVTSDAVASNSAVYSSTAPVPAPKVSLPRRTGPVEVLFTSLLAIGLLVGVIVIRTQDGEYVLHTDDPKIAALIGSDGGIVVHDHKTDRTYSLKRGTNRLPSGNYEFTVTTPEGLDLETSKFQIKRGETVTATIVAKAKADAKLAPVTPLIPQVPPATEGDYALQFDGQTSYVSIPSLNRDDPSSGTIEAWLNVEEQSRAKAAFAWGGKARMQLSCDAAKWFVWDETLDASELSSAQASAIQPRKWVHLAYVADDLEGRFYVNGQLVARGPRTAMQRAPISVLSGTWLGAHPHMNQPGNLRYFIRGMIDEARISRRSRYRENFTPATRFESDADTLALYHFDEGQGDVLKDASGNHHDGQIVHAKWIAVKRPAVTPAPATPVALDLKPQLTLQETHPLLSSEWEWSEPENIGRQIYPAGPIHESFVSRDELTLLFRHDNVVWLSTRKDRHQPFSEPTQLLTGQRIFPWLSDDGLTLLYCSGGNVGKFDLWQQQRRSMSDPFGPATQFVEPISSVENDGQAAFSSDGLSMLFCSARPGGSGKDDFWISTRNTLNAEFSTPVNLGPQLNSPTNDFSPILCADDRILLFASERAGGKGLFDLWLSARPSKTDPFGAPTPLSHVNTEHFESRPSLSADGQTLYFDSNRPGGRQPSDLWRVRRVPKRTKAPFDATTARRHQDAWGQHLGTGAEIANSMGMKFRLIPPGESPMGFADEVAMAGPEDRPRHNVAITKPFYLGATEVSVRHFKAFITATNYQTVVEASGEGAKGVDHVPHKEWTWRQNGVHGIAQDDQPVTCIAWTDARKFCDWLTESEPGHVYRLPTDAEWELACRAGSTSDYWWGAEPDPQRANAAASGASLMNAEATVTNPFGLHHILGNVWEWCLDGRRPYSLDPITDPVGPFGQAEPRVTRGGALTSRWPRLRCSSRVTDPIGHATPVTGFRVLREVK